MRRLFPLLLLLPLGCGLLFNPDAVTTPCVSDGDCEPDFFCDADEKICVPDEDADDASG